MMTIDRSGVVVWFTGLARTGKSRLAASLAHRLAHRAVLLDEPELRATLSPLGRDDEAFHRSLARLSALLARQGFVVIVAARSLRRAQRDEARSLAPRFIEVHVAAPLDGGPGREMHSSFVESWADRGPETEHGYEPPLHPEIIARGPFDDLALQHLLDLIAAEAGPRAAVPAR